MTEQKTIETLPTEEFERIVEQFIVKAAAWDGALPAASSTLDVIGKTAARRQNRASTVEC